MDNTLSVIIGTLSGFIIAFFAEPIKRYFEQKSKRLFNKSMHESV
jgi:hypothetical protein